MRKFIAAVVLTGVMASGAFAGGIIDPEEPGTSGGTSGTSASVGDIAGGASAYYGPVRSFGAKAIVFYVTTADNDSLSTATVEVSDDSLKWYAVSSLPGADGSVVIRNLASKNINGRIGTVTYAPTEDGSAANKSMLDFITNRWVKLKLTALGNTVSGVRVHTSIITSQEIDQYEVTNRVYDWQLP